MNKTLPKSFDWKFYISIYPDLVENGITTEKLAKMHYIMYGQYENRQYYQKPKSKINISKKIIINAYHNNSSSGIGDFLRGCIHIHELSQKFDFISEIDFSHHSISKYIRSSYKTKFDKQKIKDLYYETVKKYSDNYSLYDLEERFDYILNQRYKKIYVSSMYSDNLFLTQNQGMKDNFEKHIVNKNTRKFMQSNVLFSQEIEDLSIDILQKHNLEKKKYTVIHLRLGDFQALQKQICIKDKKILSQTNFKNYNTDNNEIILKIENIAKESKGPIIVMADSNDFKKYVDSKNIKNIIVIHTKSNHCSPFPGLIAHSNYKNIIKDEQLKYVALDLKLISMAKKIYSFSVYPWGSGFSYSMAKIYDIPLTIQLLLTS